MPTIQLRDARSDLRGPCRRYSAAVCNAKDHQIDTVRSILALHMYQLLLKDNFISPCQCLYNKCALKDSQRSIPHTCGECASPHMYVVSIDGCLYMENVTTG